MKIIKKSIAQLKQEAFDNINRAAGFNNDGDNLSDPDINEVDEETNDSREEYTEESEEDRIAKAKLKKKLEVLKEINRIVKLLNLDIPKEVSNVDNLIAPKTEKGSYKF